MQWLNALKLTDARLHHIQLLFTWNTSPRRPSKLFEYLLLPPRPTPVKYCNCIWSRLSACSLWFCAQGEKGDMGPEGGKGERGEIGLKGKEGSPGPPGLVGLRVSVQT